MKKLLIAAAALMAGTAALAQTPPPAPAAPPAPMVHPMADRTTSRDETVAMVREHFARLDANKDGAITTEEIAESHGKFAEKFKHLEGGPGMAFREHRDPGAAFDRMDANKDGNISRDEFAKAHEERFERRIVLREERKDGAKDGKDAGKREFRMHRMGGIGSGRMIVMADNDHDGKITLAEAEAMALQHFDQMDANKDGRLTPEERRAGRPMIIKKVIEEKKTAS